VQRADEDVAWEEGFEVYEREGVWGGVEDLGGIFRIVEGKGKGREGEDAGLTCDVTSKGPNLIRGTMFLGGGFGSPFAVIGAVSLGGGSGVDIVEDGRRGKERVTRLEL
jgi:hypothetical protein